MTTKDYTYSIGSFLLGLSKRKRNTLSDEEKEIIQNNIGIIAEMAEAVSISAANVDLGTNNTETLCYTASFLSNLVGEINGLLQE